MTKGRVVAWVAAGALIVAAGVGIVSRQDGSGGSDGSAAGSTAETSTAVVQATTTTPAATTVSPPVPVTIDLEAAVTGLDPMLIVSYPIDPPGDLHPTAFATAARTASRTARRSRVIVSACSCRPTARTSTRSAVAHDRGS